MKRCNVEMWPANKAMGEPRLSCPLAAGHDGKHTYAPDRCAAGEREPDEEQVVHLPPATIPP